MDCFDNGLENNFENKAWKLEHNVEELQEIMNRIMQGSVSIITSALVCAIIIRYNRVKNNES